MNPIEFENFNYEAYLAHKKNCRCRIKVLGEHEFEIQGMFVGIHKCDDKDLPQMGGFIADVPIYKLSVLADTEYRIEPVWINTLLIERIEDIIFE